MLSKIFMNQEDLIYVCTSIGNLAGLPIRLYRNDELVFYHSLVNLPKDPFVVHKDKAFEIKDHIGYYITSIFNYYGMINYGDYRIVIGPSRQVPASDRDLRQLAFYAEVDPDQISAFVSAMKSLVPMPFESIIQMLCVVNFVLNGEKSGLRDVIIYEDDLETIKSTAAETEFDNGSNSVVQDWTVHNTYDIENTLMNMIETGNTSALNDWANAAPAVRSGVMADNQLRQLKNTFIVTATLASRAAIRGGLSPDDAFTLSDLYIQKAELASTENGILNLEFRMMQDYTERVGKIRYGDKTTKLVLDVGNYIQHHISEHITVDGMAKDLFLSRPYLSTKFKEETGENLTDFILKAKVDEAKRLLRYADKSLTSIGAYLGFSSQSHFTRVFKKYAGVTPNEFRKQK